MVLSELVGAPCCTALLLPVPFLPWGKEVVATSCLPAEVCRPIVLWGGGVVCPRRCRQGWHVQGGSLEADLAALGSPDPTESTFIS